MNKCIGIGKLLGHKFRARYHTENGQATTPTTLEVMGCGAADMAYLVESTKSRKQTYIHDVCVRCGVIINKEPTCG